MYMYLRPSSGQVYSFDPLRFFLFSSLWVVVQILWTLSVSNGSSYELLIVCLFGFFCDWSAFGYGFQFSCFTWGPFLWIHTTVRNVLGEIFLIFVATTFSTWPSTSTEYTSQHFDSFTLLIQSHNVIITAKVKTALKQGLPTQDDDSIGWRLDTENYSKSAFIRKTLIF